jgi:ferredoxin-NADP reductase/MOSC domain-containing protein YiiM/ferredoxin
MARLLSVNVGLPRDIEWKGRTVYTGIWKNPVQGRCRVGRLNLAGDGQGDLGGHGGENRAVFAYQIESYDHWQQQLKRTDFVYGQFGENFTVQGLADDVVCIGDRFRIGSALFEVTQPRVTCYRVAIRTNEPRMPALLTSSGRPGFYLRVLEEGEVGANDEIVKVGEADERMTVAEINALLYSPNHPRDRLECALRNAALSPGWQWSFQELLRNADNPISGGNAGLIPSSAAHPVASGFRSLAITAIDHESADVTSFTMQSTDGQPLQAAQPGQYVVLRLGETSANKSPILRSYSLSGPASTERYRISVKIEPNGSASNFLREHVRVGSVLDVSSPRGVFTLQAHDKPVLLLSAGIGATPVLAMLHALSAAQSKAQVWWLHAARDGQHHPFAAEVRGLLRNLPQGRSCVYYSDPRPSDIVGEDFDSVGHLSRSVFDTIGLPREADVYICGPNRFMEEMRQSLVHFGISPTQIRLEIFNGGESLTPGIVGAIKRAPHAPDKDIDSGPLVSFARSGVAAHWNSSIYENLLELAEACDVPVRWSCRTGVCHNCESGLIFGAVEYGLQPLDMPAEGNLLLCCSQPTRDLVIDI